MPALQHRLFRWVGVSAIAFTALSSSGLAAVNHPPETPPETPISPQWIASRDVSVAGENGRFVGQVVVNSTSARAWEVLTDYGNFAAFFPNVEESQLVSRDGSQVVFEQVNLFRVAALTHRTRILVAALEQYPSQIQFSVIEGDVDSLQGVWQIQALSSSQILITHQVVIDPGSSIFREVYFNVYRSELETTLSALKQEIERRGR